MQNERRNIAVTIEPFTDEIREKVLDGIGDENGTSNSCST